MFVCSYFTCHLLCDQKISIRFSLLTDLSKNLQVEMNLFFKFIHEVNEVKLRNMYTVLYKIIQDDINNK